ncbi:MAG: hypothetical protein ABJN26_25475 [Stappiaceae bacterium]
MDAELPLMEANFGNHLASISTAEWYPHPGEGVVACRINVLIALSMLSVGACASNANSNNAKQFGLSTTKALSTINDSSKIQNELLLETKTNHNACRYLNHDTAEQYPLEKSDTQKIEKIAKQAKFLNSLAAYAKAMQGVTNPGDIAELKKASQGFAESTTKLVSVVPVAGVAGTVVAPVTKFVVNGIVNFSEVRRRQAIQQIARETHPYLVDGALFVLQDELPISRALNGKLTAWREQASCVLAAVNRDKAGAYEIFLNFNSKKLNYDRRIKNLGEGPPLMEKVLAAHKALFTSGDNFDLAIDEFNTTISSLLEVKKAAITN